MMYMLWKAVWPTLACLGLWVAGVLIIKYISYRLKVGL
jgi:hypothetical protein